MDLRRAVEEGNSIVEAIDDRSEVKLMHEPNVAGVIAGLQGCTIAHFACHGYTDNANPSKSSLILQRKVQGKTIPDRLTVEQVFNLDLKYARLAYLSACSTAENKSMKYSDEVIHLTSSFQVAGFPHVIGCLWASADSICVDVVASKFYSSLLETSVRDWDGQRVAEALRDATLSVREAELAMPLLWAQFVHYGP